MQTTVTPVPESDRFEAVDVLRGCAVLGILLINVQLFAMPMAASLNPFALGPPSTRDFAIWSVNHLFADQKFMRIFSLLFGAGVLLMTTRIAERGGRPALMHYRRMFWLLLFGLVHAYFLWYGDILVLYAVCGALIYPARRLGARTLLVLGLLVLAVGSLISIATALSMDSWPPELIRAWADDFWRPPPERIAQETAAFRGGWLKQQPWRSAYSRDFHMFDIWTWGIWRAGGLMLAGMALLKWHVFTGERSASFYARLAAAGFVLGLPIVALGLVRISAAGWTLREGYFVEGQWNYWGSILVSLGWIGLILRVWQSGAARGLIVRLAAIGRMAFTCYIFETLLCTTVFYGHGFGLFGRVDRLGQMVVTFAVWLVLLTLAPVWLQRFRFGPLEWLWRTLTYGRAERIGEGTAAAPV